MNFLNIQWLIVFCQENIVSSEGTGNDYEECLILNRKCAEFEQEIQVEGQQIEELAILVGKLNSVGHVANVLDRQRELSQRWENLKELTVKRKDDLSDILHVFSFLKTCDELLDNINEKVCCHWIFIVLG